MSLRPGENLETTVDAQGNWKAPLHTPKATPLKEGLKTYHIEIVVPNDSRIQLRDVLVGEVWLCSGQSNMVMPCGPGYPAAGAHGPGRRSGGQIEPKPTVLPCAFSMSNKMPLLNRSLIAKGSSPAS